MRSSDASSILIPRSVTAIDFHASSDSRNWQAVPIMLSNWSSHIHHNTRILWNEEFDESCAHVWDHTNTSRLHFHEIRTTMLCDSYKSWCKYCTVSFSDQKVDHNLLFLKSITFIPSLPWMFGRSSWGCTIPQFRSRTSRTDGIWRFRLTAEVTRSRHRAPSSPQKMRWRWSSR